MITCTPTAMATTTACPERSSIGEETEEENQGDTREIPGRYQGCEWHLHGLSTRETA
jgi:hypothetical protein